jgi:hypothetical protein
MASRNDAGDLSKIVTIPDETDPSAFLEMAALIVDEKLSAAGMSDARLKLVEVYLAAHFLTISEEKGGLTRSRMGNSEDWFSDVYTAGFGSTRFGQTAVSFDESGILAKMGSAKGKAEFRFVGTRISDAWY